MESQLVTMIDSLEKNFGDLLKRSALSIGMTLRGSGQFSVEMRVSAEHQDG